MSLPEYKEAIKSMVDSTNDETLLKHWKKQLEWDIENLATLDFSDEEWTLINEGVEDYKNGAVISLEEFISKRK